MADIAIPGEVPGTPASAGGRRETGTAPPRHLRVFAWLGAAYAAEGERRALWLPVLFGTGIALYFTLPAEPPWWLGLALTAAFVAAAAALWRWRAWRTLALLPAVVGAGFTVMQQARWEADAPMLDRRLSAVPITGRVVDVELLGRGWRVVVAPDPIADLGPGGTPRRIRLHIPASSDLLSPGDGIGLKARLYPVPPQIPPGGRDMQRELYFTGIGAVGYSFGAARRTARSERQTWLGAWREWLMQLRTDMTRRINAVLPGSTGGVASAVITGKRGTMAEEVKQAFRDSGLSHLLAIAGLHLGLVGGFVFFAIRGGLALIPPLALRYPIKNIAAVATLAVLFCYLLISGAAIPTQRAFVMTGIVFAAVLMNRLRLSMRICAIAAWVVMIVDPACVVVGVSFQMSFGAVVALIAVYEKWGATLAQLFHRGSLVHQVLGYGGGVAVTTLVATVGTEPYAIYHFHHLVLYSPLANVIAVPISAMWTLPWGVVACLLMPLGLEHLALIPMGWGIDLTIGVAQWVQMLPGNVWSMPRLPTAGMVLVSLGGLWLCLWQGVWRYWGVPVFAVGLATMLLTRPPDIVVGDFGRFIAARAADGNYYVAPTAEKISRSFLHSETGGAALPWPKTGSVSPDGRLDCTLPGRCFYAAHGRRVAVLTGEAGLPVHCDGIDAIVAQVPAGFRCRAQLPVADRIDTWRHGAIALWLGEDGVTMESANQSRGDRPWVPHPISRAERTRATQPGGAATPAGAVPRDTDEAPPAVSPLD